MLPLRSKTIRWVLSLVAIALLGAVYLFQRSNGLEVQSNLSPETIFVLSRLIRFLLNEMACLLLIIGIFNDQKHLRIGWRLFLLELFLLLPLYFVLKLTVEGETEISSPLLAQIHRMVVNPLLMGILIIGLLLQKQLILTSRNE